MGAFDRGRAPNELRDQAEPNTLSWVEPAAEGELEDDGGGEAEAATDDAMLAWRRAALEAELQREADEFGLTKDGPQTEYGPYGEDVARVISDLENIDYETAQDLADDWTSADPARRASIETKLDQDYRTGRYRNELAAAEAQVASWLDGALTQAPEDAELWRVVADAARGAVDGLILSDDLDDDEYGLLCGAWNEVVGGPETESSSGEEGAADGGQAGVEAGEFGPNSDLVRRLLVRLGNLTDQKLAELHAFWRNQPQQALEAAHDAVRSLVDEDEECHAQVRAAQDAVTTWTNGCGLAPSWPTHGAPSEKVEIRLNAAPAVADAVTALTVADLLERDAAQTLYGPWAAVVGDPRLPEFADEQSQG